MVMSRRRTWELEITSRGGSWGIMTLWVQLTAHCRACLSATVQLVDQVGIRYMTTALKGNSEIFAQVYFVSQSKKVVAVVVVPSLPERAVT